MVDALNNLADQLFAEKPARLQDAHFNEQTGAHRYVESRIFSGSRGLTEGRPQRLSQSAVSDKVMHSERLGPYERHLLASLLRAPHSLIIVTGSTGSGKTSSLRRVLQFYDTNAQLNEATVRLGWNPTHAYVDFNKLAGEYRNACKEGESVGMALLYEKIPMRIADALLKSVTSVAAQRKSTPQQIVLELARDACRWAAHEAPVPGDQEFDWPDLLQVGLPQLTGNPQQDFMELRRRITECARDQKQSNLPLLFWCAVLDAAAVRSMPTNKTTLLFLDNIDILPDAVQVALRDAFIALCLGKHFKVILPLRHSTFRTLDVRSKEAIEYNWYAHCGPSPVEVVCARLLGFIAQPKNYKAFSDLNEKWQHRAIHRALELLLRLTPGVPHYRTLGQLALAGAGDSIRRALETVRFLFESNDFSYEYTQRDIVETMQLSLELQALSCSSSIGLALREEIVGLAMECESDQISDELLDSWAQRLSSTFGAVIEGSFDRADSWRDPRVDSIWSNGDVQSMFLEDIETASALLHGRMISLGIPESQAQEFRAGLGHCVARNLLSLDERRGAGFSALVSAIDTALRDAHATAAAPVREDREEFLFSDRLRICAKVLSINKPHLISRSLIRGEYLHNLFVDSAGNLSLLPLTLVYYLALQDAPNEGSGGEESLEKLLRFLRPCGKPEVLNLFNRLCSCKGRVLWINHDFRHETYEELLGLARGGVRVKLTQGGWAYYLGVLDEIDYVMETLWDRVSEDRDPMLSRRLTVAIGKLERLLALEPLKPVNGAESSKQWLDIQNGAVADVIVRCTTGMIRAACGHFSKMQEQQFSRERRIVESQNTREAVIAWVALLEKARARACSGVLARAVLSPAKNAHLLPLGRVGRYRGLGPMAGTCEERWRRAMEATESVLRGPHLWAPNLGPDAYHECEHRSEPPSIIPPETAASSAPSPA